MNFKTIFLIGLLGAGLAHVSHALPNESDIDAVNEAGEMLADWWKSQTIPKPKSIAILSVNVSENLDVNFSKISETIILNSLAKDNITKVVLCHECRSPQITVKDDRLIITKGVPDRQTLIDIAKKLEVESFLSAEVVKTALTLKVQVNVVQVSTGTVVAAETFAVSNVSIGDSSFQFLLGGGIHYEITPLAIVPAYLGVPIAGDISWLEQVGKYTKAGINAGGIFLGPSGNFGYIMPTIGWKIRLGRSAFAIYPSIQAGLGLRNYAVGISSGASIDILLGRFFFVGAKSVAFFPLHQAQIRKFSIYPGFHFGVIFGR